MNNFGEILKDADLSLEDKQNWYGKKEVPNIHLTVINILDDKEQEFYIDILTQYYEEYDTVTGWKVVLELPLMSFEIYEALTSFKNQRYITQVDNWWRNSENGRDKRFLEPKIRFNQMRIEHKTSFVGDPCRWYITLWNERNDAPKVNIPELKEVAL